MFREDYKDALRLVCRQSAILEQFHLLLQEGKPVDKQVLDYHLKLLLYAKETFLHIKKELGFKDGLAFMDDANFCGFSYRGGCLIGDCTKLADIVVPWIEQEEEDAHFRYEVGTLLSSHYLMQQGRYEYLENHLLKNIPLRVRIRQRIASLVKRWSRMFLCKKHKEKEDI